MGETMTQVRERPILMSGEMVRAILDRRKTVTRRVIQPQEALPAGGVRTGERAEFSVGGRDFRCPYGQPSDRLWVREAWQVDAPRDGTWADVEFYGCEGASLDTIPRRFRCPEHVLYRATWNGSALRWRPSIHMPRWACRLVLEIVSVGVERLQEISDADARAEGISVLPLQDADDPSAWWQSSPGVHQRRTPRLSFADLWDSLNLARGYGWDTNPFVWRIQFRPLTTAVAGGRADG